MLDAIQKFFDRNLRTSSTGGAHRTPEKALQLATVSLLIEVSRADHHVSPEERASIIAAVRRLFHLTPQETEEIVALAEQEFDEATCMFEFTRLINDHFDHRQKVCVVENLWRIALADQDKDKYEEHIIRRIADLIHVSHKDFIRARHAVEEETGGSEH